MLHRVIGVGAWPEAETIVVFGGEDQPLHACLGGHTGDLSGIERCRREELRRLVAIAPLFVGEGVHREVDEAGDFHRLPAELPLAGDGAVRFRRGDGVDPCHLLNNLPWVMAGCRAGLAEIPLAPSAVSSCTGGRGSGRKTRSHLEQRDSMGARPAGSVPVGSDDRKAGGSCTLKTLFVGGRYPSWRSCSWCPPWHQGAHSPSIVMAMA